MGTRFDRGGRSPGYARHRRPGLGAQLLELLLPCECAGCAAPGHPLCGTCLAALTRAIGRYDHRCERLVPADGRAALPLWAGGDYAGVTRRVLVAWKEQGRLELSEPMEVAIGRVARAAVPALAAAAGAIGVRHLALAPIASTPAAVRRRGMDLTYRLACGAAAALSATGCPAEPRSLMQRRPGTVDQAGLSARSRALNRIDSLRLTANVPAGIGIVLVDDLATTGASLLEAEMVLTRAGARVLGALALAVTPGPQRS